MCTHRIWAAVIAATLGGLLACRSDSISSLEDQGTISASHGGTRVLTVDNDGIPCPDADYTSIQAAVTAASPGTTIHVCAGVYGEQVEITGAAKNDLRLLAKGAPGEVVLDGGTTLEFGFRTTDVSGLLIEGFVARRYHEAGISLDGTSGSTFRKNHSTVNGHDGIQMFGSSWNVVEHNVTDGNLQPVIACGINVTAGSANNVIRHNVSEANARGIQLVSAGAGNHVFHNESHSNRLFGILNFVTNGTTIENNGTLDNIVAGIRVANSTDLLVARNKAFDNATADLFWTGGGAVAFENNHCRTSIPAGLCEHTEGESDK